MGGSPTLSAVKTHSEYLQSRHFGALDGLRAVAILLVFCAHVQDQRILGHIEGGLGVTIFFVLSGYLITTLSLREENRRASLNLGAFFVRRVFRIAPVYLLVLGFYVAAWASGFYGEFKHELFGNQLPYYLLGFPEHAHFDGGFAANPPFSVSWSLGIEEKFYLVWPLLAFGLLAAGRRRLRIPVTVVLGAAAACSPLIFHDGVYLEWYAQILFGCLVAFLLHERRWFELTRRLAATPVLVAAFAGFWAVQLIFEHELSTRSLVNITAGLTAVALFGLVLSDGRVARTLTARPLVFLGRISYVFYLIHVPAIQIAEKSPLGDVQSRWGVLLVAAGAIPLAIVASYAIHRLVEQPMIDIGRRLGRARFSAPPQAAGT